MTQKLQNCYPPPYDLSLLPKERISHQCVACGSRNLSSSPAVLMPFVSHRALGWEPVVIDESWGLQTIKLGNAYSLCKTLCCRDCHLLFLDLRFSEAELSRLYHDYRGEEYNRLREFYEPGYTLRNDRLNAGIDYIPEIEKFLEPFLQLPLTVLDWGGDTGKNTPFKEKAEVLHVYDISNKEPLEGIKLVGPEELRSQSYSLIICSNVLEHVPFPADLLLELKKAMNKESVLYIEVPFEEVVRSNNASGDLHLKKKHWHEHINFFSEKSLECLLKNVGFDVMALSKLEVISDGKASHLFQLACRMPQ